MDSRWYSKFYLVVIGAPILVWSQFDEGGDCSMRSHIHAWNMAWGWLAEREIWFSHVYGWVVHGSPEPSQICLWLIKAKFSYFWTCLYVDLMVVISMIFVWFYVGYKHGYMIGSPHGYFMYLLVIFKWMDATPNWWYNSSMDNVVILLVMFHKFFQSFMLCLIF